MRTVAFVTVLIFYLLATFFYLLRLIVGRPIFSVLGLRATLVAAAVQFVVLALHVFTSGQPFFTSYLDYFQTSALILATLFILLCFAKKFYVSGPLFIVLIDVLCILSLTYDNPVILQVVARGRVFLVFHLIAIFLSLPIFAMGLISALLFLIEEQQIKNKQISGWVAKLPPLVELDDVHYKALYTGFLLFTFAILMGAGYAKMTTGHYLVESAKEVLSILLWIFLAVLLNFRMRQGWQGHKGVLLSLVGFVGMLLLFFVGFK